MYDIIIDYDMLYYTIWYTRILWYNTVAMLHYTTLQHEWYDIVCDYLLYCNIYIYIYIYVYVYMYTHTYMSIYIERDIDICIYLFIDIYTHI